jgi:hypothetical protein
MSLVIKMSAHNCHLMEGMLVFLSRFLNVGES